MCLCWTSLELFQYKYFYEHLHEHLYEHLYEHDSCRARASPAARMVLRDLREGVLKGLRKRGVRKGTSKGVRSSGRIIRPRLYNICKRPTRVI